jgi:AcrR family transcriptional regulator
VRTHRNLYRVVSMAQFVAEDAFREYYSVFASAYEENLKRATEAGEIREGDSEVWSWALIGMTVFLGMRFADWDEDRPADEVAGAVADLISTGMAKH